MRGMRPDLRVIDGDGGATDEVVTLDHTNSFPPPATLPEDMRDEWHRVIGDLQARKLFKDSMLGIVTDYLIARWTISQAQKAIAEKGAFVAGAGGALKPNPATGLLCRSQDTAARLAAELGLTPVSRGRKSLQPSNGQGSLFPGNEWDL
jgi:P27 family predicted phage terminase small subunit